MMGGLTELRKVAVLGASTLALVAACDSTSSDATQGELASADLPGAGPGGNDGSPSGQAGAPLASPDLGSSGDGNGNGEGGAPELGEGGARELGEGGARELGEGGAPELGEGGAGMGGALEPTCDRIADVVPTTCPMGGPAGAYRETGLGFLEVTGWMPHEATWPAVSAATAINASGDVVGYATLCDRTRAILYRGGTLLELDPIPAAMRTMARDINDEGDVLGLADEALFVWKNGVTTVLGGIGPGFGGAINNLGQVLGSDQDGAFIWDAGLVTRLGLEPSMRVTDLNDRGQVTGYDEWVNLEVAVQPAFVWEDGVITSLPPLPGDDYSAAWAINEAGQVVGSSVKRYKDYLGVTRAVLWESGVPVDITPPTDYPLVLAAGIDINESGVVLGHFQEAGPRSNSAGFVFEHGVTTRIFPEDPTVGAALSPRAINDAADIAGTTLFWTGRPNQATVWSRDCFGACCQ
jgi:hypothetical protein